MAPTNVSDVKCFNCGKFGHFRWHCPSTQTTRVIVRDRFRNGASAIHIVHELLSYIKNEDKQTNDPTVTNLIDNLLEFDELCKQTESCESSNDIKESASDKMHITNHIATHFQPPSSHYGIHRLSSADPGLKDFYLADK